MSLRYALARSHKPLITSHKTISTTEEEESVNQTQQKLIGVIKSDIDKQQQSQRTDCVKSEPFFGRLWAKLLRKTPNPVLNPVKEPKRK